MKFLIALCLIGFALARPDKDATIVSSDSEGPNGAEFRYSFDTSNGISASQDGTTGIEGQSNKAGSFSFTLDDGTQAVFNYVADENGYRVDSPLLPVAPPAPAHVAELLRIADEQRSQGITFK